MRIRSLFSLTAIAACVASAGSLPAQTPVVQYINQSIIINGQAAQGEMIVANGAIQSQSCPAPQQYETADRSSTGWACFDQTSQTWFLHAVPPAQAAYPSRQAQAPVYVQTAPPVYSSYSYPYGYYPYYPYAYYPYSYPYGYYYGPTFAVGFGFGFGYRAPFVGRSYVPFGRPGGFVGAGVGRAGFARAGRR